jgi:hypothetical protein|tara:strand:- start:22 stop:561 length:540 start_codon:yes stop_codon:yes gene_type:complete
MNKSKNEKQMQIYGEAEWVYFDKPDNKYAEPGEYKCTLKVPKAKSGELICDINEVINNELRAKYGPNTGPEKLAHAKKPYTVKGDIVEFKLHSQFKPIIWGRDQNKLDEKISVWSGSTMWANCKASGYTKSIGIGATLLLGMVQIDKLIEGSSQNGECPFPKREGSVLPTHKAPEKAVY